MSLTLKSKT